MLKSLENTYELSPNILRWVVDAVGPGTTIQSVRPLAGATSSLIHSIEVKYNRHSIKLVLRRFVNEEWLKEEPDLALHEAASLKKASEVDVPTPELIAYDEKGVCCGVPTVLMTQLPGSVELKPINLDNWLYQLAEALIPIHVVEAGTHPWNYFPWYDISSLEPPTWSKFPKLWEKAIEVVAGPRPKVRECFIHRDYHPTNVLWQNNQISGIVDWVNACRGPAGIDLSHCRGNLVALYGVLAADRFLHAYQSLASPSFEYHPYWDLNAAVGGLPGPPNVYSPWLTFGVQHL